MGYLDFGLKDSCPSITDYFSSLINAYKCKELPKGNNYPGLERFLKRNHPKRLQTNNVFSYDIRGSLNKFPEFFLVWALLLIVHI